MATLDQQARCLTAWVRGTARARAAGAAACAHRRRRRASPRASPPAPPPLQLNGFSGLDETELTAYRDGSILLCVAQDV